MTIWFNSAHIESVQFKNLHFNFLSSSSLVRFKITEPVHRACIPIRFRINH